MKIEPYRCLLMNDMPTIVRDHGQGHVMIGRAGPDGAKIVEEMNRLVDAVNRERDSLREDALRAVTDAIEGCFDG